MGSALLERGMPMKLVRDALTDAVELAESCGHDRSWRTALRCAARQDAYRILLLERCKRFARRRHIPLVGHALRAAQGALFGIEIDRDVTLGNGVYFVHSVGVVVGGDARVGDRVRFYGNNTVGTVDDNGYPTIDEDVIVGAGARILGPVHIGARAVIGANAVVLCDVPPDHVAAGIPAKVWPKKTAPDNVHPLEVRHG
jgi:serine O-acetyltransferase